jgi:hypothetical protein
VATYTATCAALLLALHITLGLPLPAVPTATALTVSAITHWLIDRRWLLVWAAEHTGTRAFVHLGAPRPGHNDNPSLGTGAYALDQSAHYLFLFIAALILATGT